MSMYYYGSGLTYIQYLQAKTFVSDVKSGQQKAAKAINLSVAKQTRELIASQEALARENIHAMDAGFAKGAQATQEGFEQLSWEIQDVSRGISEINATFQWGFGEMLNQMTRLNDMLGNVSEWVLDWYIDRPWRCPEADPIGPEERRVIRHGQSEETVVAKGKVTRGGSYADPEEYVKRGGVARPVDPKIKLPTLGFRLARTAVPG